MTAHRLLTTIAALALAVLASAGSSSAADKPNLVLIIADDLGYADVGFNGCPRHPHPGHRPHRAEGVRFTDAYVTAAVCGPSRAGLITGPPPGPLRVRAEPDGRPRDPQRRADQRAHDLRAARPAGYESIAVGKWHLGTHPGLHPRDRGFDEFYGFLTGGHDYFPENLTLEDLSEVTRQWEWYRTKLLHNGQRVGTTKYLTDELSDRAVEFIDRDRADDQPVLPLPLLQRPAHAHAGDRGVPRPLPRHQEREAAHLCRHGQRHGRRHRARPRRPRPP
jgi:arylsulfatase A-like enzyme